MLFLPDQAPFDPSSTTPTSTRGASYKHWPGEWGYLTCPTGWDLCLRWILESCVSTVNTFNNQSEWVLTKRAEQALEVLLLWVDREQGDTPGLGEHLLSSIIDLGQYCNKQSDVW